jgi:LacI family transcriptional regulator
MVKQRVKVTMEDVARLAEVSSATVSAVINGNVVVSPLRTKRVREAMEALDYHPDQVARSLKVGRTFVIGMVIPDVTNAFFPEVIRGVEDSARAAGYSVILCNSNEDSSQEERHLNVLFSRRVDGVLLAYADSAAAYDRLLRRRSPLVFFDRIPTGMHRGAVGTDNITASQEATRHLVELGHRDIAFVAGDLRLSPHADRLEGFRRAMHEFHLPIHDRYLEYGDLSVETGYRLCKKLARLESPPTAIISSNNKMMLGILRALRELDLHCPEQVSVIGFDDPMWTEFFNPPLTVVAQRGEEIGRRAFQMLLTKIEGKPVETDHRGELVLLDAALRIRQSTAPPCR